MALGTMRLFFQNSDRRAEVSALAMILAVLMIGVLTKLDAAVLHVAR